MSLEDDEKLILQNEQTLRAAGIGKSKNRTLFHLILKLNVTNDLKCYHSFQIYLFDYFLYNLGWHVLEIQQNSTATQTTDLLH